MARIKDAAALEWLKAEKLVRKHGLPLPGRKRDEIAKALAAEIARPDRSGNALLRGLCALLWSAQQPADAALIAQAKFIDMDSGAMVDADFLLCGDGAAVQAALAKAATPSAAKALATLKDHANRPVFSEKLAAEQAFYGIEAPTEDD
jgi:hypothetical protein